MNVGSTSDYLCEVLTPEGRAWVSELVTKLEQNPRGTTFAFSDDRHSDLEWIEDGGQAVLELPKEDSQGNNLLKDTEKQYVLKIRNPQSLGNSPIPWKHKRNHFYGNETFGELRIWFEANHRGYPNLFADITDYDQDRASWYVQRRANAPGDNFYDYDIQKELEKKLTAKDNWTVSDPEVGWVNGRAVFIDFGEFWLRDDWIVRETDVAKHITA